MFVQSSVRPNVFSITVIEKTKVKLRKNIEEKMVEDQTIFEYDEVEVTLVNRSNIEEYISTNFDALYEIGLNGEKEKKLKLLSNLCEKEILEGFISTSTGHKYDFDRDDQANFNQRATFLQLNPDETEIIWKTEDAGYVIHTKDQFLAILKEAENHKMEKLQKYWDLKNLVLLSATSIEVENINW